MNTMLALVYHGPQDLRVEERPWPELGAGEALLKVNSAGICGTDLRIYHGAHRKFPPGTVRIPGHEVSGEIVAVGPRSASATDGTGLELGQRVFVAPNMGCGHCRQCVSGHNNRCADYQALGVTLDGAFAQYVRIPAAAILQGNLIPIASDTDPAVATLIEPFACVLHGQDAVGVCAGDMVLIVGAGPIGVMHTKLARLRGARRVIVSDLLADRLPLALQAGADRTVNPSQEDLAPVVARESQGSGADVIIVAAPAHGAQEEALQLAAIGGRVNYFGGLPQDRPTIQFNSNMVHYKELVVTGTTACSTDDCWRAAELVNSRRIDLSPLISARYPLHEAVQAFAAAENRAALKIVVEP
jgi:L-iditol 2-dehydrogenase